LADQIHTTTGRSVTTLPVGTGAGRGPWLLLVQQMMNEACDALGVPPPPDLATYNLSDQDDFASWMYTMSQQGERLRITAGLP